MFRIYKNNINEIVEIEKGVSGQNGAKIIISKTKQK